MSNKILKVHPEDNIAVALVELSSNDIVTIDKTQIQLSDHIPTKHKLALRDIGVGENIVMYGAKIGVSTCKIEKGQLISTHNVKHDSSNYKIESFDYEWIPPDIERYRVSTFLGYHRRNGKVGTRNYWLIIPLVFCENRNLDVIEASMLEELGYQNRKHHSVDIKALIEKYKSGATSEELLNTQLSTDNEGESQKRIFPNVDGIKFLRHEGGCGSTPSDVTTLCKLLGSYINHPNVAGATVLSLGCQMAQIERLKKSVNQDEKKPLYFLEQQQYSSEREFINDAIKQTFVGLIEADKVSRQHAPLSKLSIGLECGGSDGFSGISANPTVGHLSDLIVALRGRAILSEFPELHGVEQDLINRCTNEIVANRFTTLMESYHKQLQLYGSGFDHNPSPGNIKDGIVTHAMKSAGAAKKGGASKVVQVLDYGEEATKSGLHLLCTPGNDVESTTGLAGSGANIILFTTGLGTPTGNPICPVIKISSNSELYNRMNDIIDFDTGEIIKGKSSIEKEGEKLLSYIIEVASGNEFTASEKLGQDDFIPWKRGISL